MNFEEYSKLALRTESQVIASRLIHAALGMATETAELLSAYKAEIYYGKPHDEINWQEEIGDFFWFLALAYNTTRTVPQYGICQAIGPLETLIRLHYKAAVFLYSCQYGELTENIQEMLNELYSWARHFCGACMWDIEKVWQQNIDKLRTRYPEKFTPEAALDRNLEAERDALKARKDER